MKPPRKILIRGVNWLGDAVMTTPALQRLREAQPQAHITLLTHAKLAELWQQHPAVDAVIPFEQGEGVFSIARLLRAKSFDLALLLPNSVRSALEVFFARIPQRVGAVASSRNIFLTHRVALRAGAIQMRKRSTSEIKRLLHWAERQAGDIPATAHQIHHYLHLVAALGADPTPMAPHIAVADEEVTKARQRFGVPPGQLLFGLNPGAEYGPAKRWPCERFVEAAIALHERANCHWWIFGSRADTNLANTIADALKQHTKRSASERAAAPVSNLAGQTSLRELCAAMKACDAVLTNDSGPMHVAAAVGASVVALFGSTSSELTGPGLPGDTRHVLLKSNVPCSPCFRRECPIDFRCMRGLSVETVVKAALRNISVRRQETLR